MGRYGIHVVGVAPGLMVHAAVQANLRHPTEDNLGQFEIILGGAQRIDLQRPSLPEEVANVVAFLATDAAGYIAGTTIRVSGG